MNELSSGQRGRLHDLLQKTVEMAEVRLTVLLKAGTERRCSRTLTHLLQRPVTSADVHLSPNSARRGVTVTLTGSLTKLFLQSNGSMRFPNELENTTEGFEDSRRTQEMMQ